MSRPLTETEMRDIIRAHPEVFLSIARLNPGEELAQQVSEIVAVSPEALASIVKTGLDLPSVEATKALGYLAFCASAVQIVSMTQQAHTPETLLQVFTSEIARLVSRRTPAARLSLVEGGRE